MAEQSQTEQFYCKLLRKLESVTGLSDEEKRAIMAMPCLVREVSADKDVISIGDKPTHCCVVIEGWACRYKMTPEGKRQIMSFHIPGDMPDLQSLYIETMDHSVSALTPLTVGLIPHRDVLDLIRSHEGIAKALWRDSLVEAAIFREWMVCIGRRSAHQRIAHQFCEMATKARSVGLNDGHVYPWPVTQVEIADSLGMSDVHVNRTLRDLRQDGLVDVGRRFLTVHDWERLAALGQFDPQYLHLVFRQAA